jgi:hypothetical protein
MALGRGRHHVQHAFPHLVPAVDAQASALFEEVHWNLEHHGPHGIQTTRE